MWKLFFIISLFTFGIYANEYEAPGNVRYPLGDEVLNNNVIADPPINELKTSTSEFKSYKNKCNPVTTPGPLKENSVPCNNKNKSHVAESEEILYSYQTEATPEVTCKKCTLNITPDNSAVIVSCFECFDFAPQALKNRTSKDIVYQVYFLQIAHYTADDGNYHNVNNMQANVMTVS